MPTTKTTVTLTIIFGQSLDGLAEDLVVPREQVLQALAEEVRSNFEYETSALIDTVTVDRAEEEVIPDPDPTLWCPESGDTVPLFPARTSRGERLCVCAACGTAYTLADLHATSAYAQARIDGDEAALWVSRQVRPSMTDPRG